MEYRWSLLTAAVSCMLHMCLTLRVIFLNCWCICILSTTMDGSVGNDSPLKPIDARQQPKIASTTNVFEAVFQKHSLSRKTPAFLQSSSPNCVLRRSYVKPLFQQCILSLFSPLKHEVHHRAAAEWLSMDSLHNPLRPTMAIDRPVAHSIVTDNGH